MIKIIDLANKLGLKPKELREKAAELGVEIGAREQELEDEQAMALELAIEEKSNQIFLPEVVPIQDFALQIKLPVAVILTELLKNGIVTNQNESIDFETAAIIAEDLGKKVTLQEVPDIAGQEKTVAEELLIKDNPKDMKPRPPVISIMGHVDHGKTKLLDAIRNTNVVDSEAGGITQKIGAYQVQYKDRLLTFLDTPGHEAFTAMRARGARSTDIAILVVAADDGVKTQTIEAINHAREAGIPIVVAINKIDLPGANPERVKKELADQNLLPEEWGGSTVMVEISAKQKQNIEGLLDMVLLVADMAELKANPDRPAAGTIIESRLDPSLGPVATVLVQAGTLRKNQNVVVGSAYGRVRLMRDYNHKNITKALPGTPVFLVGLNDVPQMGDTLLVCSSEQEVRAKAMKIMRKRSAKRLETSGKISITEIAARISQGKLKVLKVVLKADTKGSMEAIKQSFAKIKSEKVRIDVIHDGVGEVTDSDVIMAAASQAILIAFNVRTPTNVKRSAMKEGIKISEYDIIYRLLEDVEKALLGILGPEIVETVTGKMTVAKVFFSIKEEKIFGGKVDEGKIVFPGFVRFYRGSKPLGESKISGLQKGQAEAVEVDKGYECGVKVATSIKPKVGDVVECFKREERKARL